MVTTSGVAKGCAWTHGQVLVRLLLTWILVTLLMARLVLVCAQEMTVQQRTMVLHAQTKGAMLAILKLGVNWRHQEQS
jgi:hypothetical protein